jgi:hypothetical protein
MHLKTHDPSIVFPCSVCRKEFNRKQNLKVHYRTVHLGLKPFECVCGQSFGHKHLLQRHLRTGDGFHAEKSTEMGTNFSEGNETHKDMFDIPTTCTEIPSSVTEIPMQPTVPLQTTSILNDLTGFGHSRFSADRPIPCYVDQCAYRFKRIYDLQRHVLTYHSMGVTMDEELLAH